MKVSAFKFISFFWLILQHFHAGTAKYNVLFIVSDDLRPEIGGPYGQNDLISTPNFDALMDQSFTFTHAYCQQALCGPSRTSFLTGLRPDTSRVWEIGPYFRQTMPNNTGYSVITLPQYFKENGYYTVGAGKVFHPGVASGGTGKEGGADMPYSWSKPYWYCDQWPNGTFQSTAMQQWPNGTGCVQNDSCISCLEANGCWGDIKFSRCGSSCDETCFPDGAVAQQIGEYLKYIHDTELYKTQPFFIAAGLKRPHLNWYAPKNWFDLYPNDSVAIATHYNPPINMSVYAFNNNSEIHGKSDIKAQLYYETIDNNTYRLIKPSYHSYLRASYYATVSFMDSALGTIMESLQKYGFLNNTIISFIGDHGFHLGEQGIWAKITNFELGTRVPMIIRIPGVSEGLTTDYFAELLDLFPTIVEAAGLEINDTLQAQLEGKSLLNLIKNATITPQWPNYAYSQQYRDSYMGVSLRTDNWRYTEWVGFGWNTTGYPDWNQVVGVELYNHNSSINENDLNAYDNVNWAYNEKYQNVVQELHNILVNTWDNQTWGIKYKYLQHKKVAFLSNVT